MFFQRKKRNLIKEQLTTGWRQIEPTTGGRSWWQQLGLLFMVVFFVWLFWWLLLSPTFNINQVNVEEVKRLSAESIRQQVNLEGKNIFRVNSADIMNSLQSESEIADVQLIRVLPRQVRLVVTERAPVMLWRSTDNWYLIDQRGIAFRRISESELLNNFNQYQRVIDIANVQVNLNEPVVPRTFIKAFTALSQTIPTIFPEETDYYEVSETVYDLDLILKNGKRVRFNILSNVEQQLAALKDLATKRPDLVQKSYIDLRVERWAYIK